VHDFIKDDEKYKGIIIYRLFLTTGRSYKNHKMKYAGADWHKEFWDELPLPHFVWVCELLYPEDYKDASPKVFGELVLDSTSGDTNKRAFSLLYLRYLENWTYQDMDDIREQDVGDTREQDVGDIQGERLMNLYWWLSHTRSLTKKYLPAYQGNLMHVENIGEEV
jgi:hypothetical protein